MVRWLRWHCPPDTGFEIRALAVWGRARYLSVTKAPHNTNFHTWMGKKQFCFFQTAETGTRTPDSGVKGSGANHYPRASTVIKVGTCCFTSVHSVLSVWWVLCVPFISGFLSCRQSNTRRWPNAGLMLAHRLRRWANISPVLVYCVVSGATLNVGQRHRRQANINPALVQSIVPVLPACRYRQHEVLTRAEWILASTGNAGPAFNRD